VFFWNPYRIRILLFNLVSDLDPDPVFRILHEFFLIRILNIDFTFVFPSSSSSRLLVPTYSSISSVVFLALLVQCTVYFTSQIMWIQDIQCDSYVTVG
jgi:hypothetical protein